MAEQIDGGANVAGLPNYSRQQKHRAFHASTAPFGTTIDEPHAGRGSVDQRRPARKQQVAAGVKGNPIVGDPRTPAKPRGRARGLRAASAPVGPHSPSGASGPNILTGDLHGPERTYDHMVCPPPTPSPHCLTSSPLSLLTV